MLILMLYLSMLRPRDPVAGVSAASDAEHRYINIGAGLHMPLSAVQSLQATVDCWLTPGAGANGTGEGGSAWVAGASSSSTGWLYAAGSHLGPFNFGVDSLQWVPGAGCGARWSPTWDAERAACILARFGGVFFMGDSISQQHFFSLLSAFAEGTS